MEVPNIDNRKERDRDVQKKPGLLGTEQTVQSIYFIEAETLYIGDKDKTSSGTAFNAHF